MLRHLITHAPKLPLPLPLPSSGDLVTLSRENPLHERAAEAVVMDRSRFQIRVLAGQLPRGLQAGVWRCVAGVGCLNWVQYECLRTPRLTPT